MFLHAWTQAPTAEQVQALCQLATTIASESTRVNLVGVVSGFGQISALAEALQVLSKGGHGLTLSY